MKFNSLLFTLFAGATLTVTAATPPPEKLLPSDTLVLFTIPDWDKSNAATRDLPAAMLWRDQAMKAFVDKFTAKWKSDVLVPLERELGIKLDEYSDLAHGQFTFAVTQNGWTGQKDPDLGVLLLLDSRDKAPQLAKLLSDLKKRWTDSGKKLRNEKIRDVEFTTLVNAGDEISKSLQKAFPGAKGDNAGGDEKKGKSELTFGQSGSLLLVGNNQKDLEKVLIRQSGGAAPALAEVPAYEANHSAMFRDSTAYGWIHCKPLVDALKKQLAQDGAGADNPLGVKPDKAIDAIGLGSLQTMAMNVSQSSEGTVANFFIGAPENGRKGIFKMLVPETKEAAPPAFVSADVVKFSRCRLDGQKLWATLEATIGDISPQVAALVQLGLANAGKDKDPNFDLKKQLIGNLGNDLITYQRGPRSAKLEDLSSPPSLFLLGSPNPDQILNSFKLGVSMINPAPMKEREFLGRKIYSLTLPPMPGADGKPVEKTFSLAASGGYVAMSADAAILEEYLRSAENKGKPLADLQGLKEAAQKVGGMGTGWFGYDHQGETIRVIMDAVKQDPNFLEKLFSGPLGNQFIPGAGAAAGAGKNIKEWFDFALLPSYDKISKFFYFTVNSASANADGISFKTFSPTPPGLKK